MIEFLRRKTREFTKDELLKVLKKERGVSAKGKKAAIQAIAQEHGLPIRETSQIVVEGWEENQKASYRFFGNAELSMKQDFQSTRSMEGKMDTALLTKPLP
ncbi:hypothetical protein MHU86_15590 [Fragilaria crotonensis]|nr:hypothetical protein MHU86_15590 [Fragilaria crotonensis]